MGQQESNVRSVLDNKLIPVYCAAAFRVLQTHEAGETFRDEWKQVGRNKMIEDEDALKIVDVLTLYSGKTISYEEIKEQLKQAQMKKIQEQGRVPLTNGRNPCNATILNYKGLIYSAQGVCMIMNITQKLEQVTQLRTVSYLQWSYYV